MFLLDLYKWCEGYDRFTRQHIAKFIYTHRECARMAKLAGVTPHRFATLASREFLARMMGLGYIDGRNLVYWSNGFHKRPFSFDFRCVKGESDRYTWEMNNVDKLSDEELFAYEKPNGYKRYNQILSGQSGH